MMIESANPPAQALWWWPIPSIGHLRLDDQREDEDADHDRREPVQDVEPELHLLGDPRRRELADVDRDQHADRQRDRRRDRDEHERADERRRDAAAGLAEDGRPLGEEVPVERVERLARAPSRRGSTSSATAISAATRSPRPRRPGSCASRRRERPVAWSEIALHSARSRALALEPVDDALRDEVRDERDHEQDQPEVDERRRARCSWRRSGSCSRAGSPACSPGRRARAWNGRRLLPITCVTAIASPSARPRPERDRRDDAALARTGRSRRAPSPSASRRARSTPPSRPAARSRRARGRSTR